MSDAGQCSWRLQRFVAEGAERDVFQRSGFGEAEWCGAVPGNARGADLRVSIRMSSALRGWAVDGDDGAMDLQRVLLIPLGMAP